MKPPPRKPHQQHQRSQSVAGTRSSPKLKAPVVAPDTVSNHRNATSQGKVQPAAGETASNHSSQNSIDQVAVGSNENLAYHTKQNSIEKELGCQSEGSLLRQISQTQVIVYL